MQHEAVVLERVADPVGPGQARLHALLAVLGASRTRATRSRPASLASYIAMSASTSSSSPVSPATPANSAIADAGGHPAYGARRQLDVGSRRAARSSRLAATSSASPLVGPGEDHRELVAAERARSRRSRAAGRGRCSPTAPISSSPTAVTERVVDVLEVVEVDRQHRAAGRRSAAPARARARAPRSKRRRLNRPVSASWSARYCSWPSKRLRSVMSWTWARKWLRHARRRPGSPPHSGRPAPDGRRRACSDARRGSARSRRRPAARSRRSSSATSSGWVIEASVVASSCSRE